MSARPGMFALVLPIISATFAVAQSATPSVVCIAGQCIQGYSNITIGAQLSASGASTAIHLLPGQYTFDTSPQLLHDILVAPSSRLDPSPGFQNDTSPISLPLDFALQPGLASYSNSLYSGQASFTPLSTDPRASQSTPLTAGSLALSSNSWAALSIAPQNLRLILWDSIPDVSQLPASGSFSLLEIQSQTCTPQCSSAGICNPSGTCTCAPGFEGNACETCSPGHFGPDCRPCPENCDECDQGITGTGICLKPTINNVPDSCNCDNGVCGSDGQCTCNPGFTTGDDGRACSKCDRGFFLTSSGDCQVCQLGCEQCTDGTGVCTSCRAGFSLDNNDRTRCNAPRSVTSTGTVCPNGAFANGNSCAACDAACSTCTGASSNDCVECASGRFTLNGSCVGVNADGVCDGSNLVGNNLKRSCDTCPAKCTSCRIPEFSVASLPTDVQCTACLPGFFLSNGQCVESCPTGTFLSQDGQSCTPCDSSCSTCSGSATFCLSCPSNRLASNGTCVTTCPSNTFSSGGACLPCHTDCESCTGGAFNQCTSCPASRPVLSGSGSSNSGRCLPTCAKTQFFDPASGTCQACHASCASCSGSGPNECLSCQSSTSAPTTLRGGQCVSTSCGTGTPGQNGGPVVQGLGVCLSDLVVVPDASETESLPPLPTITGLDEPTKVESGGVKLEWWQILLMVLGCVFIFVAVVWLLWCRRRNKRRKQKVLMLNNYVGGGGEKPRDGCWAVFVSLFRRRERTEVRKEKLVIVHPNWDEPKDVGYTRRSSDEESDASRLRRLRSIEEGLPTHYERAPTPHSEREYYPQHITNYNVTHNYSSPSFERVDENKARRIQSPEEEEEQDMMQLIDAYAHSHRSRSPTAASSRRRQRPAQDYDTRSQHSDHDYERESVRRRGRDDWYQDHPAEDDDYYDAHAPLPPPPRPRYPRSIDQQSESHRRQFRQRLRPPPSSHRHQRTASGELLGDNVSRLSAPSVYSQMTGVPRRAPEPRMRVRHDEEEEVVERWRQAVDEREEMEYREEVAQFDPRGREEPYREEVMSTRMGSTKELKSRFSMSTLGTAARVKDESGKLKKKRGIFWRR